jgi:3-methyl-2-oxobutanoate hydroxymethyltransferase
MNDPQDANPVTLTELKKMCAEGRKIAMLTCYEASFAALFDRCGVDALLVGDSLGNTVQGQKNVLPVTLDQMAYHTECVCRGTNHAFILSDLPFGSYEESPAQAMRGAARLMAAGAQMVKLEGGEFMAETVRFLTERGVPVCGHIGLIPQSVHQLGGYRVQGRDDAGAARLKADALALEQAGATLLVMEMIPAALAGEITAAMTATVTIGIGAGSKCNGQVLVMHDMLGVFPGKTARFVRNFMQDAATIDEAVTAYISSVKDGSFPSPEHCY